MPEPGPAARALRAPPSRRTRAARARFSDKYKTAYLVADLACNVDHGIIGLMDPAHGLLFIRLVVGSATHSREGEEFRAHPEWLPHGRAHSQLEQRAVQAFAHVCRRGFDHDSD